MISTETITWHILPTAFPPDAGTVLGFNAHWDETQLCAWDENHGKWYTVTGSLMSEKASEDMLDDNLLPPTAWAKLPEGPDMLGLVLQAEAPAGPHWLAWSAKDGPRGNVVKWSTWHLARPGESSAICGRNIPAHRTRKTWNEPEPPSYQDGHGDKCANCLRRTNLRP